VDGFKKTIQNQLVGYKKFFRQRALRRLRADCGGSQKALHWAWKCGPFAEDPQMKIIKGWAGIVLLMFAMVASAASPGVQMRTVKGTFADVRDRVVMALENRGLVLNYTAKVGDMLERTGRDLGSDRRIYGNAEVLEFCSARLSRDTMEADPHNIAYCPYAIAVYTLPKSPGIVYLTYRLPEARGSEASRRSLQAVGKLLADVVAEAAN
jgi:uncharacterized protein (DUF302 family)